VKIEGPLITGRFVARPNRFITLVEVDGKIVRSHLPDPGRLQELLVPGAELLLRPRPEGSARKTDYSTVMVRHAGQLVSLVSALPNRFVRESLLAGELPMLQGYSLLKPEITVGRHRFDFLLTDPDQRPFYLEVKSVTFVENGVARFPDAVSERGSRHAGALKELTENGDVGTGVLFVCQRSDAREFRPMWDRDPKFGRAIAEAHEAGVKVWCITVKVTVNEMTFFQEIPVNLSSY